MGEIAREDLWTAYPYALAPMGTVSEGGKKESPGELKMNGKQKLLEKWGKGEMEK